MTSAMTFLLCSSLAAENGEPTVRVGSKTFTESVILGEIADRLIDETGTCRPASPRAGRHAGPLPRPRGRRAGRLSRVHRDDLGGDPLESRSEG